MVELVHLIYVSKARIDVNDDDIIGLLTKAKIKNASRNITGMLLYDSGCFMQVLEGREEDVNQLFASICKDRRHHHIVKIITEAIPARQFHDWTMGYASISQQEMKDVAGMNDFFAGKTCLIDIDKGRAQKLLNAFANGRWRLK